MALAAESWSPGDVVGIPYRGVRHEGIVSLGGDAPRVVHSSKRAGRVVEEDLAAFAAGRPVRRVARSVTPAASVGYARACIGRRWTYGDNCQSFTREVSGVPISSPDTSRLGWAAVGLALVAGFLR